jgi:serine/threonine-protein kinase BUR1
MVRTPPKRTASRSPDNDRPYKRATTSSPEEGEVKDDDDHKPPLASLPPRPVSPIIPALKFETKVKFPFKKKNGVETSAPPPSGFKPELKGKATAVIYERSEEDERRIREKEQHWKQRPSNLEVSRRKPLADHWEPSFDNTRDKERSRLAGSSWQHDHDERDHRSRRGKPPSDWNSYLDRRHGRSSPSLSRSPPSSSSTHRGKHRLPSHRECSPVYNFSPPRRDYGVDRIRDKQREKDDAWEHDRDIRYPDDDYSRRDDRQFANREWERGREREPDRAYNMNNGDRYWRPAASPQQDYHRRDEYDYHRPSHDGDRRRGMDSYRPSSPGPSTRTTPSAYPPRSFSPAHTADGPKTPPPPSDPPPPPPPEPKDETLPYDHPTVSISVPIRRPGAPLDLHSPTPLPLPPPAESVLKQERERKDAEDSRGEVDGMPMEGRVGVVRKREPVRRTRKEEYEAYGRSFEGCGMQSEYDVTTKLGEGTFGWVYASFF